MADIESITSCLRDLLGPDVVYTDGCWEFNVPDTGGYCFIQHSGDIFFNVGKSRLTAATLDKLHAASTVVRRMAGEAV